MVKFTMHAKQNEGKWSNPLLAVMDFARNSKLHSMKKGNMQHQSSVDIGHSVSIIDANKIFISVRICQARFWFFHFLC